MCALVHIAPDRRKDAGVQARGEPPLREELRSLFVSRVLFAATILLDTLLLLIIVPVLWLFGWVRDHVPLHGLADWFMTATEALFLLATLLLIALYIFWDVQTAYRRLRAAREENRHDRP